MLHQLKVWPEYFQPIIEGRKTFEVRVDDRGFQTGDILILYEYDPEKRRKTGRGTARRIGYILEGGRFGVDENTVVMSLLPEPLVYNPLQDACSEFIRYRDRVGPLGFQLEKADDYFRLIREALTEETGAAPPQPEPERVSERGQG